MTGSWHAGEQIYADGCRPPRCELKSSCFRGAHRSSARKSPAAPRSCQAPMRIRRHEQPAWPDRLAPPSAPAGPLRRRAACTHPCTAIHGLILACSPCKFRCRNNATAPLALRAFITEVFPRYGPSTAGMTSWFARSRPSADGDLSRLIVTCPPRWANRC